MSQSRFSLLIPALLAIAACAAEPALPPMPPALPPIVPHDVALDESLLVGRWDCHELGQGPGRTAPRRAVRAFSADGQFELVEASRSGSLLARGEWVLDGPRLVVNEIELLGRGASAAIRPASAEVVMLTSKVMLIRGAGEQDRPLLSCGRLQG